MNTPEVISTRTTYSRTLVLNRAPVLEYRGASYLPTALRYEWYTARPYPVTVDVLVRRLKKNGQPGRTTSVVAYALDEPRPGWEPAPNWILDLIQAAQVKAEEG